MLFLKKIVQTKVIKFQKGNISIVFYLIEVSKSFQNQLCFLKKDSIFFIWQHILCKKKASNFCLRYLFINFKLSFQFNKISLYFWNLKNVNYQVLRKSTREKIFI